MFITQEADYAVRLMDCMADGGRFDAARLATQTGVTPRFTLKILRKLMLAGLVRSFQGAKGGYELAREPQEITLRAVIEAIDGPCYINRCIAEGSYACSHPNDSCCRFQKTFFDISQMIKTELDKQTFKR